MVADPIGIKTDLTVSSIHDAMATLLIRPLVQNHIILQICSLVLMDRHREKLRTF